MTQKKIKVNLSSPDIQTFDFNGQEIQVKPYLSVSERVEIASEYLYILFHETEEEISHRYIISESALILQIIDLVTNIDVENIDVNLVMHSGLWDKIKNRIANYQDFRYSLERLILLQEYETNLNSSLGSAIDRFGNRLSDILSSLPEVDEKVLKETSENFINALNDLNDKIPGVVKDKPAKRGRGRPPKKAE